MAQFGRIDKRELLSRLKLTILTFTKWFLSMLVFLNNYKDLLVLGLQAPGVKELGLHTLSSGILPA